MRQAEKERRRAVIMELQRDISEDRNARLVGSRQRVLIDREEGNRLYGRTEHDAPEIDNEVVLPYDRRLHVGTFCEAEIVEAYEYDLLGKVIR